MNVIESNFNEWHKEKSYLKNEIDNLKNVNDDRVKEIEKFMIESETLKKTQWFAKQN